MKKMLIVLGAAILGLTGLSTAASATGNRGEGGIVKNIDCDTSGFKLWLLFGDSDREELVEDATELYASVFSALDADEDGIINVFGQNVTVTLTGDADGGTITLTDEGVTVLTASLNDGEYSFEASAEIVDYFSINVSFFKDRLGDLCGNEPFTVCLGNALFLVEAEDLADYLVDNPTAVVINASVGCAGAPGQNGTDGDDGSDGADGAAGPAGPAGPAGQTVVVEKIVEVPVAAPVALPRTS